MVKSAEFLAIATGVFLGCAYFLLKFAGVNGGLALFGTSSLIVFTILVVPFRKCILPNLLNKQLIWRGFIFGVTQILICESIRKGTASAAMSASILGSVAGMAGGRFFLNERIKGKALLGALIAVPGAIFCFISAPYSFYACIAGIFVGTNSTLTRAILMDEKNEVMAVMSAPLLYAGVLMTTFELLRFGPEGISKLSALSVFWFTICLFFAQYLTCVVLKLLDSQKTAGLTLIRLPTTAALELIAFGKSMPIVQLFGLILISIGAACLFIFGVKRPVTLAKPLPKNKRTPLNATGPAEVFNFTNKKGTF